MIKIALAGLASVYSRAFVREESFSKYTIAAVTDSSPERAQAAASVFNAAVCENLDALLALDPDAVIVGVPSMQTREVVEACSDEGIAVMLWLEGNTKDFTACRNMCDDAASVLAMVSPFRYYGAVKYANNLLTDNAIGRILGMRIQVNRPQAEDGEEIGGALSDCAAPAVDLARWMMLSEVRAVYADTTIAFHNADQNEEDLALLHLDMTDERFAGITALRSRPPRHPEGRYLELEIIGERGTIRVRPGEQAVHVTGASSGSQQYLPWGGTPFTDCVTDFADAIQEEKPLPVPLNEAERALSVIEYAHRSVASGCMETVQDH